MVYPDKMRGGAVKGFIGSAVAIGIGAECVQAVMVGDEAPHHGSAAFLADDFIPHPKFQAGVRQDILDVLPLLPAADPVRHRYTCRETHFLVGSQPLDDFRLVRASVEFGELADQPTKSLKERIGV